MNDKSILLKKIHEALSIRDTLKKNLEDRENDLVNIEAHIQAFNTILYGKNKKEIETYNVVPNYHITTFPIFLKNNKHILSVFSIGVPTKFPLKSKKLEQIFYTVGYKSKRLYYKYKGYPDVDDDYIIYNCRTLYEDNHLIFEIKTDDGLTIKGDGRTVFEEFRSLMIYPFEYTTTEEFFGMCSEEVNLLIRDKYDLGIN
ncbi:transforming growth factor beta regulator-like protein [Vairimorpha necatrix]|uniref:Transforming growth factor beta regulator-like protein n=1 Tax=Vairimorpha necatrix TaxID=6039 RepID=A0AAX4JDP7_9MICR